MFSSECAEFVIGTLRFNSEGAIRTRRRGPSRESHKAPPTGVQRGADAGGDAEVAGVTDSPVHGRLPQSHRGEHHFENQDKRGPAWGTTILQTLKYYYVKY